MLAGEVISKVEPKDLQTRKYGCVWEAFIALQKKGAAIDQLTVRRNWGAKVDWMNSVGSQNRHA